jgi:hypothetical protein
MSLPQYKGSVLRGGFGSAFRRIACAVGAKACDGCELREGCPYAYVFETAPAAASEALRNLRDVPRPFVVEPPDGPEGNRTLYDPGELLSFGLILVGHSVDCLPYFVATFRELGRTGIGPRRAGFDLDRVSQVDLGLTGSGPDRLLIYENDAVTSHAQTTTMDAACLGQAGITERAKLLPDDRLAVNFLTMTRLTSDERTATRPDFQVLARALLRRTSAMAYFHHGVRLDLDYQDMVRLAGAVTLVRDETSWVDWHRYSNRQDQAMAFGGLVGPAVFEGHLRPFLELLTLGSFVHVGKGATFGLGRYDVNAAAATAEESRNRDDA